MSPAAEFTTVVGVSLLFLTFPIFWSQLCLSVKILSFGYLAFGLLAVTAFRPSTINLQGANYAPIVYFQSLHALYVVGVFAAIATSVFFGGAVTALISPGGAALLARSSQPKRVELQLPPRALWLSALFLFLYTVGIGPSYVLYSPGYLAHSGPAALLNISTALLPIAIIIASNVMLAGQTTQVVRVAAFMLLLLIQLFQLGQSTRAFALTFVLILAGGWLTGRWNARQTVVRSLVAVAVSIMTLGIPLQLRGEPQHGLVPALNYIVSDPPAFFSGNSNPLYNVLLGAPLSLYVANQAPSIPTHALWTSINPAPGNLTDWPKIAPTLRLNSYEPYGAIGELLNHGWFVMIIHFVLIGMIFEFLTRFARRLPGQFAPAICGLVVGVAGLLLIRSTQYNLRAEIRLVYYVIAGVMLVAASVQVLKKPALRTESRITRRSSTMTASTQ